MRLLALLALCSCTSEPTFEERHRELAAEATRDCGTVTTTCGTMERAVAIVDCMNANLASKTGARALRPNIDRETHAYAVDGELVVIERTYGEDLVWRWEEKRCTGIAIHPTTPSCVWFEAYDCD
jgi:hypothetical protein